MKAKLIMAILGTSLVVGGNLYVEHKQYMIKDQSAYNDSLKTRKETITLLDNSTKALESKITEQNRIIHENDDKINSIHKNFSDEQNKIKTSLDEINVQKEKAINDLNYIQDIKNGKIDIYKVIAERNKPLYRPQNIEKNSVTIFDKQRKIIALNKQIDALNLQIINKNNIINNRKYPTENSYQSLKGAVDDYSNKLKIMQTQLINKQIDYDELQDKINSLKQEQNSN